jgi:capsular polysaccharide biosynthesis protein
MPPAQRVHARCGHKTSGCVARRRHGFGEVGDELVTSRQPLDVLARHWRIVAVCAVLGAAIGLGGSMLVPPSYTVRTELFLASAGATPQDRLQNGEFIRTRVPTYASLVTSAAVLDVVRRNLNIPASEKQVADDITATNPLNTVSIGITVTDSSARRAEAVAAEISSVADSVIAGLETEAGGASPVRVAVVTPAVAPTGPDGPSRKLYAALGIFGGILVGAGAGLLRDARAQRRRSANSQVNGVPLAASRTRHDSDVGSALGTGQL